MSKLSSLITLVHSLSKSEQKSTTQRLFKSGKSTDYAILYKIIESDKSLTLNDIKNTFQRKRPNSNFNTGVSYLYDILLNVLSELRKNQDSYFSLFNQLMHAKVLFEKSLYGECFELLLKIQNEAIVFENFMVLHIAQKIEHDFLLGLDFPDTSENELLTLQYKINDSLKKIRKINEHAFLYGILKHRLLHSGVVASNNQKQTLNDLVVSEMSIVSSTGFNNFEIQKTHKLFQSNYLIAVGDYKSALNSFYELNAIFEKNKHLLSNPPIYYLNTIEGVLESLRVIRNYNAMPHFIDQLKKIKSTSTNFNLQVKSVIFLYTLVPFIDTGCFEAGKKVIDQFTVDLIDKINMLLMSRQLQILLYISIVNIGLRQFSLARKTLNQILNVEREIYLMPAFKAIRLIYIVLLYEIGDFDLIESEIRSVKRQLKSTERSLKIEKIFLKFISKPINHLSSKERTTLWNKNNLQLKDIAMNKYENQLLLIFDFAAWIESKIMNISFSQILNNKINILSS
ncbi:MAG: hypothetical protein Q7U47_10975 [Paludibacter sp.]|nr:hypothetical protein [Paludibacter sp.]